MCACDSGCVCVVCCVYHTVVLCGRWRGLGLSRRLCAWRVAGHEVPGDGTKAPQPPLVQCRPPGPPGTCPTGCWPRPLARAEPGESGAPAICSGRGSRPRGHTASILIILGCHAAQISQRAPEAPILRGRACLSSLVHVSPCVWGEPGWCLLRRKLRSGESPPGGEVHQLLECSCLPFATRWESTVRGGSVTLRGSLPCP